MRILLGLGEICGYYSQLADGLRGNGADCIFINLYPSKAYECRLEGTALERVAQRIAARRVSAARGSARRGLWYLLQAALLPVLFVVAICRYDAFILNAGNSFFFGWDLWLLRLCRKRVIVVYHGSDARPPYLNAAVVGAEGPVDYDGCAAAARAMKRKIRRADRYVDLSVNHVMTAHFHDRPVINWLKMGIPFPLSAPSQARDESRGDRCVIVHAPTRPGPKGSDRIEAAIASLRRKGHEIEFVKLVNRPNSDVLAAIARCDFVVDELFSDTTMASFATEAASFGKPAIVGLYGLEKLRQWNSPEDIPPAHACHPDEVEPAIERLIRDVAYRRELGARAEEFLRARWSPAAVAARFERLLRGEIPADWWFDPAQLDYVHGWGLREQRLREILPEFWRRCTPADLGIGDKPRLQAAIAGFGASPQPASPSPLPRLTDAA